MIKINPSKYIGIAIKMGKAEFIMVNDFSKSHGKEEGRAIIDSLSADLEEAIDDKTGDHRRRDVFALVIHNGDIVREEYREEAKEILVKSVNDDKNEYRVRIYTMAAGIHVDIMRENTENVSDPHFVSVRCRRIASVELNLIVCRNVSVYSDDLKAFTMQHNEQFGEGFRVVFHTLPKSLRYMKMYLTALVSTDDIIEPAIFPNLTTFIISQARLRKFSADRFPSLKRITITYTSLSTFPDLGRCNLESVTIMSNHIERIDCEFNILNKRAKSIIRIGSYHTKHVNIKIKSKRPNRTRVLINGSLESVNIDTDKPLGLVSIDGIDHLDVIDGRQMAAYSVKLKMGYVRKLDIPPHVKALSLDTVIADWIEGGENVKNLEYENVFFNKTSYSVETRTILSEFLNPPPPISPFILM